MPQAFRDLFNHSTCLLAALPLFAQADKKGPEPSPSGEAIKDLLGAWWLWGGIIVVLVLVGLLYYVRKNQDDD